MPERDQDNPGGDREPDVDLAELARVVRALTDRIDQLEGQLSKSARKTDDPARPVQGGQRSPQHDSARSGEPAGRRAARGEKGNEAVRVPLPIRREESVHSTTQSRRPVGRSSSWQVGPLKNLVAESLAVVLLGACGGLAILMGLLYFAWYSIQQGWISPMARLTTSGFVGLACIAAAWRLEPRGQRSVAAALGGAGLGAWFGTILVARHVHQFLDPSQTLVLLVLGAAAGFAVASHRRLRFLASLAALGAVLTPLAIGSSAGRLHELMGYQLIVVGFLYLLEDRRRWPELGHFASLSSWILLIVWSTRNQIHDHRTGMLVWSFVYLIVGHVQAGWLLRRGKLAAVHAAPRLWLHGYLAWLAVGFATRDHHEAAYAGLAMAALNGFTALLLLRGFGSASDINRAARARAAGITGLLSVAWIQLFAFAPTLRLDDHWILVWWTAMAAIAAAVHIRVPSFATILPVLMPFAGAVLFAIKLSGEPIAWLGFGVAAIPFAIALWPGRKAMASVTSRFDNYLGLLLVIGGFVWSAMAWNQFENWSPQKGWYLLACLLAVGVLAARAVQAPSSSRSKATLLLLTLLTAVAILVDELDLFSPGRVSWDVRLWHIGCLGGVVALTFLFSASFKHRLAKQEAWNAVIIDWAGLLRTGALVLIAMVLVTGTLPSLTEDPVHRASLNQAGWSLCWAIGGLSMLVRGLFARRDAWRRDGILLLFVTAGKVVVFDLTHVSTMWRVLSCLGLGICMLLGAYAYRRLASSLQTEPKSA